VIYHIIRRWMLIQRRRIAFDRARQRRADMLANRDHSTITDTSAISVRIERTSRSDCALIASRSIIGSSSRHLVLPAGDLPHHSPLDADSAPPHRL
jgi:small-conductance mechanosensitive channel